MAVHQRSLDCPFMECNRSDLDRGWHYLVLLVRKLFCFFIFYFILHTLHICFFMHTFTYFCHCFVFNQIESYYNRTRAWINSKFRYFYLLPLLPIICIIGSYLLGMNTQNKIFNVYYFLILSFNTIALLFGIMQIHQKKLFILVFIVFSLCIALVIDKYFEELSLLFNKYYGELSLPVVNRVRA